LRYSLETVADILTNFLKIGKDFRPTENKTAKVQIALHVGLRINFVIHNMN